MRGSYPIQTVNQRHRQLKQFLLPFHGVATKCLGNYLRWHQEIGLASQPSPRACLLASLAPPMHTFRELSQNQRLAAQNTPNSARIAPRLANLG